MVCVPAASEAVVNVALVRAPDVLTFTGLPTLLPSIWNWTVPVGEATPGNGTLMLTVKVTAWASDTGLADDVTTMLLLALVIICPPINVPLLLANVLSPL